MWYVYELDSNTAITKGTEHLSVALALKARALRAIELSGGFYRNAVLSVRWVS